MQKKMCRHTTPTHSTSLHVCLSVHVHVSSPKALKRHKNHPQPSSAQLSSTIQINNALKQLHSNNQFDHTRHPM